MKVAEYLQSKDILTTESRLVYAPYLTTDGQDAINNIFKYEYGNKDLVYTEEIDIRQAVDFVLLNNYLEYTKIKDMLDNIIDPSISRKVENMLGKTKETITPAETTTTTTPAETTKTNKPSTVTTTTTPVGETREIQGTDVTENIESTKPFDAEGFIESNKNKTTYTPTNRKDIISFQGNEVVAVTQGETGEEKIVVDKDEVSKVTVDTPETKETEGLRADVTTEEITSDQIEQYLKWVNMYKINLYNTIAKGIMEIITPRVWSSSYYEM